MNRHTQRIIIATCFCLFFFQIVSLNLLRISALKTSLGKVFLSLFFFLFFFFFIQRKGYFLSEFINCDKVSLIRRLIDSVLVSHMVFNIDTSIEVSSFRSLYLWVTIVDPGTTLVCPSLFSFYIISIITRKRIDAWLFYHLHRVSWKPFDYRIVFLEKSYNSNGVKRRG